MPQATRSHQSLPTNLSSEQWNIAIGRMYAFDERLREMIGSATRLQQDYRTFTRQFGVNLTGTGNISPPAQRRQVSHKRKPPVSAEKVETKGKGKAATA